MTAQPGEQRHSLIARLAHWAMALAVILLIGSGWRIYNNAPIFPFTFPVAITLGGTPDMATPLSNEGGTANAIAWHFAAMWLLAAGFLLFVANGVISGHFRRDFLPVTPRTFLRDFVAAARFRLEHRLGEYNAVQKLFYWGALLAILMMILSGLAIWKPVQLGWLTWLLGGFPSARVVHFLFMTAISLFLLVHLALVALVPRTLQAMVLGRAREPAHGTEPVS